MKTLKLFMAGTLLAALGLTPIPVPAAQLAQANQTSVLLQLLQLRELASQAPKVAKKPHNAQERRAMVKRELIRAVTLSN